MADINNIGFLDYEGTSYLVEKVKTKINEKADYTLDSAKEYTDTVVAQLVGTSPEVADTLGELYELITEHQDVTDALEAAITNKVDKVDGKGLSTNDYTNEEKAQMAANKNDIVAIKEDIEDLQNDIVITTSATLVDSKAGGLRVLEIQGNTVQNGTPTPSNPIPILNYGDCVEMIQGYYNATTGVYTSSANHVCSKHKIPCKSGDVIAMLLERALEKYIVYYNNDAFVSAIYKTSSQDVNVTVPSGVTHFTIAAGVSAGLTPQTIGKIQLTVNGKYLGCVRGHGKNFWQYGDISFISAFRNSLSIPKGTYTISFVTSLTSGSSALQFFDKKGNAIVNKDFNNSAFNSRNSITVTLVDDVVLGGFYSRTEIKITDIQIEQGETMTVFEPYRETIAWYYTKEPTRLGDVKFKDVDGLFKIQRNVAEVVLNGSESWGANNYFTNTFFIALLNNMKSLGNGMCSHYVNGNINNDNNNVIYIGMTLNIRDESATTVDEFKAKLQASPIALQYELATPTIEVLDTQSQINLNSIETFDGVTYLEVDSRVKPLGIEGEYGTSKNAALTLKALNDSEVANTDKTYPLATQTTAGLMSAADKTKLDSIEEGGGTSQYVHPNSGVTAGTYRSVTVNAQGHVTAGSNPTTLAGYGITDAAPLNHTHNYAGSSSAGGAATSAATVATTTTNPTTYTSYYLLFSTTQTGNSTVRANNGVIYQSLQGTASANGYGVLVLGNATASGTAGNKYGRLDIYSSGIGKGTLSQATTTSAVNHTLPATGGTILNTGTTSFTQSLTSGTKVGTIKINGTSTDLYAPTNTDTHYTTGLVVGASATATANAAATNGNVYLNVMDNTTVRNAHKIAGSGLTTVTSDASGHITVTTTHPTTSGNKHIPSGGVAGQMLTWSADGTAAWRNEPVKKYIVMGDSYAAGYVQETPSTPIKSWCAFLKERLGVSDNNYIVSCLGGAGFVHAATSTFLNLLKQVPADNTVTDIIVAGGYNDSWYTLEQIHNAIEEFKTYASQNFPNAKLKIAFVGSTKNPVDRFLVSRALSYYKIVCAAIGVEMLGGCEYALRKYETSYSSDGFHPNLEGQRWIAEYLYNALRGNGNSCYIDYNLTTIEKSSIVTSIGYFDSGLFGSSIANGVLAACCQQPLHFSLNDYNLGTADGTRSIHLANITSGLFYGNAHKTILVPMTAIINNAGTYYNTPGSLCVTNGQLHFIPFGEIGGTSYMGFNAIKQVQLPPFSFSCDALMC